MPNKEHNVGVMDASYAQGRDQRPHLRFRYEVRALLATEAFRDRAGGQDAYRVLELGAAEGRTLLRVRELLGGRGMYHGVELSESLLASAPQLPSNVALLHGDVMALPDTLEPATYDLCTALAVLEHLPTPLRALQEAFRMLRPGGVLVATCPHPLWDSIAGRLRMVQDEAHEQKLGKRELVPLAVAAGFEHVTFEPFMWAPFGTLPYLGIKVAADVALRVDDWVRRARFLGFSFVNQALVGVKPDPGKTAA